MLSESDADVDMIDESRISKSKMAGSRISLSERVQLIRMSSQYKSISDVQKAWKAKFNKDAPSRRTISSLNKKFDATGSVADMNRRGRPKSARTEAKINTVKQAILEDPSKSIRSLSKDLGINKTAVHRIKSDSCEDKKSVKKEVKRLREMIYRLRKDLALLQRGGASGEPQLQRVLTYSESQRSTACRVILPKKENVSSLTVENRSIQLATSALPNATVLSVPASVYVVSHEDF